MDLSLETVAARLRAHVPSRVPLDQAPKRAAVAALLRWRGSAPEVLLMLRAEHESDRWSGHVSMPGGRHEATDPDLLATATRETREEVGIDLLASANLLGELDSVRAVARGKVLPLAITPFVFVERRPTEPVLNYEVSEVFWLPLQRAAAGELDDRYPYRKDSLRFDLPCWRFDGRVVWGLTFDMLGSLLQTVRTNPESGAAL